MQWFAGFFYVHIFKKAKAVSQQFLGIISPLFLTRRAEQHGNQTATIALGRHRQMVTGIFDVASFQTIYMGIGPQQTITVGLAAQGLAGFFINPVLEILLSIKAIVFGVIFDDMLAQGGQVSCRRVMVSHRPARSVLELSMIHAQTLGGTGHQLGKGILATGDVLGHSHAGVVARNNNNALEQIGY